MATETRSPARWVALFGPGAVIASLTIGAGELIFSSRGGALFGYRLLAVFLFICLLKWALVIATARHIVLTGAHPLQRWSECPGPRGWLPLVFLLLAIVSFPVWVGFHAGTVGTLLASLTGTQSLLNGGCHYVWGLAVLLLTMALVRSGGYQRLERIQIFVVLAMMACVSVSLVLLKPNLTEMVQGFLQVARIEYPDWIQQYPDIAARPLWVELATYVGVVGGSGYDYLAYAAFLRDKQWGAAAGPLTTERQLREMSLEPQHPTRRWLVAPWCDASLSFAIVFLFSAVFLTCGTIVLRPGHKIPTGSDLLTLQAEFVGAGAGYLKPVYFAGAMLAMLGTLYGTIEVAPAVAREFALALSDRVFDSRKIHRRVTGFVGLGGAIVLIASLAYLFGSGASQPPGLIALLTPANLFTGVLACGVISLLSLWADYRWLPAGLRMAWPLVLINLVGGCLFVALGLKAYWDHGGTTSLLMLVTTVLIGWAGAAALSSGTATSWRKG